MRFTFHSDLFNAFNVGKQTLKGFYRCNSQVCEASIRGVSVHFCDALKTAQGDQEPETAESASFCFLYFPKAKCSVSLNVHIFKSTK